VASLQKLRTLLGERFSTAAAVREPHGQDACYHPGQPPDVVVFARIKRGLDEQGLMNPGKIFRRDGVSG